MPALDAVTSNRKPATDFDHSKRDAMVVAMAPARPGDRGRPLTDVDWNAAQLVLLHQILDVAQWGTVAGAMAPDLGQVLANGSGNSFSVVGGGANFEATPFYLVGRYPAVLPWDGSVVWGTAALATAPWLHRRATSMGNVEIVDDDAAYGINALVDRSVYVATYDTIGETWETTGPFNVIGNIKHRIQLAAGANLLTDHGPGSYYWLAPGTPSSGTREDTVLLDVYLDEIAPTAVAGDPIADASLLVDVAGAPLETTRRMRLRQSVFYSHATAGVAEIPMTLVPGSTDVYTYVDTSFKVHYVVKLAAISRRATEAVIRPDDIVDPRSVGGAGAQRALERLFLNTFHGVTVFTAGAPVKNGGNAAQLDIPERIVWHLGRELQISTMSMTAPTAGTAWAGSTAYVVYVDVGRNVVAVPLSTDPGMDSGVRTYLASFTTNGGGTDIGTVTDEGRYAQDFFQKLHFDAQGRLRKSLKVKEGAPVEIYNNAASPVLKGRLGYNLPETGGGAFEAALALVSEGGVPVGFGARKTTGEPAENYEGLRFVADQAWPTSGPDWGEGSGTGVLYGVSPDSADGFGVDLYDKVKFLRLKRVLAKTLRAPAIEFGDPSTLLAAPIAFSQKVNFNQGGIDYSYVSDLFHFKQVYDYPYGTYINLKDPSNKLWGFGGSPFKWLQVPVPKGSKLDSITAHVYKNLPNPGGTITLRFRLYTCDSLSGAPGTNFVLVINGGTQYIDLALSDTGSANQSVIFNSGTIPPPAILATASLFITVEAVSPVLHASATSDVILNGIVTAGELRASGTPNTGSGTNVSAPLIGM